ncbi:hypothetical protein ACMFMG_004762 [Clarireedia jacksonii]
MAALSAAPAAAQGHKVHGPAPSAACLKRPAVPAGVHRHDRRGDEESHDSPLSLRPVPQCSDRPPASARQHGLVPRAGREAENQPVHARQLAQPRATGAEPYSY